MNSEGEIELIEQIPSSVHRRALQAGTVTLSVGKTYRAAIERRINHHGSPVTNKNDFEFVVTNVAKTGRYTDIYYVVDVRDYAIKNDRQYVLKVDKSIKEQAQLRATPTDSPVKREYLIYEQLGEVSPDRRDKGRDELFARMYAVLHIEHDRRGVFAMAVLMHKYMGDLTEYATDGVSHTARGPWCSYGDLYVIASQLAWACSLMHNCGYVHCDIKPENVFFWRPPPLERGAPLRPTVFHVGDLGSAVPEASMHDAESGIIGTFEYAAPELIEWWKYAANGQNPRPQRPLTRAIDMWACGATLFRMATGLNLCHSAFKNRTGWSVFRDVMDYYGRVLFSYPELGWETPRHDDLFLYKPLEKVIPHGELLALIKHLLHRSTKIRGDINAFTGSNFVTGEWSEGINESDMCIPPLLDVLYDEKPAFYKGVTRLYWLLLASQKGHLRDQTEPEVRWDDPRLSLTRGTSQQMRKILEAYALPDDDYIGYERPPREDGDYQYSRESTGRDPDDY